MHKSLWWWGFLKVSTEFWAKGGLGVDRE